MLKSARNGRVARPHSGYPLIGEEESEEVRMRKHRRNCIGGMVAGVIAGVAIAIAALILALQAHSSVGDLVNVQFVDTSGEIKPTPYNLVLSSSAAPTAHTLPNDLTPYIGATYSIHSSTAQPHTITIDAGSLTSTWDGTNTIATFGGAIGDGLTFRVIAKDRIVVIPSPTNVAFS